MAAHLGIGGQGVRALVRLVDDGNPYHVLRLTVENWGDGHQTKSDAEKAAPAAEESTPVRQSPVKRGYRRASPHSSPVKGRRVSVSAAPQGSSPISRALASA